MEKALETMRATSVMGFAVFGAVGFGIGGTIAGVCWPLAFVTRGASALLFILSGAVGGALLGLAVGDRGKTIKLVLLGMLGFTLGGIVALVIGFGYLSGTEEYGTRGVMGIFGGTIGGASLGAALGYLETRKPAEERSQE